MRATRISSEGSRSTARAGVSPDRIGTLLRQRGRLHVHVVEGVVANVLREAVVGLGVACNRTDASGGTIATATTITGRVA